MPCWVWINVLVGANNLKTTNLANFRTRGLSAATGQGMSTCLITKCLNAYQTSPYIHTWSLQARNKPISKCIRLRSMSVPCLYSIPHGIVVHWKPAAVDHSMGSKKQLDEAEICSETHGMYLKDLENSLLTVLQWDILRYLVCLHRFMVALDWFGRPSHGVMSHNWVLNLNRKKSQDWFVSVWVRIEC